MVCDMYMESYSLAGLKYDEDILISCPDNTMLTKVSLSGAVGILKSVMFVSQFKAMEETGVAYAILSSKFAVETVA